MLLVAYLRQNYSYNGSIKIDGYIIKTWLEQITLS